MISSDEWTKLLSGDYSGWARSLAARDSRFEDLLGRIRVTALPRSGSYLDVELEFLEWGRWTGRFDLARRVLQGPTGEPGCEFVCTYHQRRQYLLFGQRLAWFEGTIRKLGEPVVAFHLHPQSSHRSERRNA